MYRVIPLFLVVALGIPSVVGQPVQDIVPSPIPKARENNDDLRSAYRGRVVGLTEQTVTIKPEGYVKIVSYYDIGNILRYCTGYYFHTGMHLTRTYIQENTEPPRTHIFDEHLRYWSGLRAAPPPGGISPYFWHKIGDLRMGDVIGVSCQQFRGADYCGDIRIYRRPGGQVPPVMGDNHLPPEMPRWHTIMNTEQYVEERILPKLPRLFR